MRRCRDQTLRVRHEQIVADKLNFAAKRSVSSFQPSQSSSEQPSSIEMIGYLSTASHRSRSSRRSYTSRLRLQGGICRLCKTRLQQRPVQGTRLRPPCSLHARSQPKSFVIASSLDVRLGAKPPSSPTAVFKPFSFSTDFRLWKISAPVRSASRKLSAPTGMTMNS